MRNFPDSVTMLLVAMLFVVTACSENSPVESDVQDTYQEIDYELAVKIESIDETITIWQDPEVVFIKHPRALKRFRNLEEADIIVSLVESEAALLGKTLEIHEKLKNIYEIGLISAAELSFLDENGQVIVGDELYTLESDQITRKNTKTGTEKSFMLNAYDPVNLMSAKLSTMVNEGIIQLPEGNTAKNASTFCVSDSGVPADLTSDGWEEGSTDLCYRYVTYSQGDKDYDGTMESNVSGILVMWNSSITYFLAKRAHAYTKYFFYDTNGPSIDDVDFQATNAAQFPSSTGAYVKAIVRTKRKKGFKCVVRSDTDEGEVHAKGEMNRCSGNGTWSDHWADLDGVSLYDDYRID